MTNFNGGTGFGGGSLPPSTVYGDLTVTGKIKASDGALDAPSYTFSNDTKVGIYRNQGAGHGLIVSGGSGGAQLLVTEDGANVTVTGTFSATGLVAFGSGASITGTVSTTGTVTTPQIITTLQPIYKRTATYQSITKGSNQYLNFDTFASQIGSGNFTYAGNQTTVVNSGYYYTNSTVRFATGGDPGIRNVFLYYNGAVVAEQNVTCSTGEYISLILSYGDYLTAGQTIYVQVYSNVNPSATMSVGGTLTIEKTG